MSSSNDAGMGTPSPHQTRPSTGFGGPSSLLSPPSTSPTQGSLKPRRPASVTPRRFKRFFTPRSAFSDSGKNTIPPRRPLFDIGNATVNARRGQHIQSSPLLPLDDIEDDFLTSPASSKLFAGDITSSPIRPPVRKRIKLAHVAPELKQSDQSRAAIWNPLVLHLPHRIKRIKADSVSSRVLNRECSSFGGRRTRAGNCGDWITEVDQFCSRSTDVHICRSVEESSEEDTLPFCVSSCNSNSLVAIGDESGGIRLLETLDEGRHRFDEPISSFRPHMNAIMDITFSEDDSRLATASGDQSAKILDMPTQKVNSILEGHSSSVKVVKFQPGRASGDVVATAARDGKVMIWDLRCSGPDALPSASFSATEPTSPAIASRINQRVKLGRHVNVLAGAHADAAVVSNDMRAVSITGLAFLPSGREHLMVTSCEADACVKLWDLRMNYSSRQKRPVPLATTRQPESHNGYRKFGLTSLAIDSNGSLLYGLCRDNAVYAYSVQHLILGQAPEFNLTTKRTFAQNKIGLGPLYSFRHPMLHASTFYIKLAMRKTGPAQTGMLAVGSGDGCAVVFPTDEAYLTVEHQSRGLSTFPTESFDSSRTTPVSGKRQTISIPTYSNGVALMYGHSREVSDLSWTYDGSLVTIGDDKRARLWKESSEAERLRQPDLPSSDTWNHGWASLEHGRKRGD